MVPTTVAVCADAQSDKPTTSKQKSNRNRTALCFATLTRLAAHVDEKDVIVSPICSYIPSG